MSDAVRANNIIVKETIVIVSDNLVSFPSETSWAIKTVVALERPASAIVKIPTIDDINDQVPYFSNPIVFSKKGVLITTQRTLRIPPIRL